MKLFLSNCIEAFRDTEHKDKAAAQGTVPVVLITAGFAVVAVLIVMWIGNTIAWQAHLQARCIAQTEGFETTNGNPGTKCIGTSDQLKGPEIIDKQINETKGGRF